MYKPLRMSKSDSVAYTQIYPQQFSQRVSCNGFRIAGLEFSDNGCQSITFKILHSEVRGSIHIASDIVNRHDIRVFQSGSNSGFHNKPVDDGGLSFSPVRHSCHSDVASEFAVIYEQNGLHPAEPDCSQEAISLAAFLRQ